MNTYRVHVRVDDPKTPGRPKQLPTFWEDAPDEATAVAKVAAEMGQDGYTSEDIVSAVAVPETN